MRRQLCKPGLVAHRAGHSFEDVVLRCSGDPDCALSRAFHGPTRLASVSDWLVGRDQPRRLPGLQEALEVDTDATGLGILLGAVLVFVTWVAAGIYWVLLGTRFVWSGWRFGPVIGADVIGAHAVRVDRAGERVVRGVWRGGD
jgi:hypothetical protein